MRRRLLRVAIVVMAVTISLAVYFEPSHCVRGWLWGETFYDGRPTSYWREVVVDGLEIDWPNFPSFTWRDRLKRHVGYEPEERWSLRLMQDRAADPVLRELAQDRNRHVAAFAHDILDAKRGDDEQADYLLWVQLLKKHNMR
jgi:hypothetical protein